MHLGKRLIWHEHGWDGTICKHPDDQVDCRANARNAELFDLEIERQLKGDVWEPTSFFDLPTGREIVPKSRVSTVRYEAGKRVTVRQYRPPCWECINVYGHRPLTYRPPTHGNRYASRQWDPQAKRPVPKIKFKAQDWTDLCAGTFIATPYAWMLEDLEAESEPNRPWTLDPNEETRRLAEFWSVVRPGSSYVFFFCRGHHPFEDECPNLPVGVSTIDWVDRQRFHSDSDPLKRLYPVWQRAVHHAWPSEGFRIPWHQLDKDVAFELARRLGRAMSHDLFPRYETELMQSRQLTPLAESMLEVAQSEPVLFSDSNCGSVSWLHEACENLKQKQELRPSLASLFAELGIERPVHLAASVESLALRERGDPIEFVFGDRGPTGQLAQRTTDLAQARTMLNGLSLAQREWCLLLTQLTLSRAEYRRLRDLGQAGNEWIEAHLANPFLLVSHQFTTESGIDEERVRFGTIEAAVCGDGRGSPYYRGMSRDDPRLHAALLMERLLRASAGSGSTHVRASTLPSEVRSWLDTGGAAKVERSAPIVNIDLFGESVLALSNLYDAETDIAQAIGRLHALAVESAVAHSSATSEIPWVGPGVYAICGKAGTGKTHTLATMLAQDSLVRSWGTIQILAPTGRAATVLAERLGSPFQPTTIHAFLQGAGWAHEGVPRRGKGRATVNTLIVDEGSMVDSGTFAWMLRAIDKRSLRRIVLIGDAEQLPPIGAGRPFFDIVAWLRISAHRSQRIELHRRVRTTGDESDYLLQLFERQQFTLGDVIDRASPDSGQVEVAYWKNGEELTTLLRERVAPVLASRPPPSSLHVVSVRNGGIGGVEYLNHALWLIAGGNAKRSLPLLNGVGGKGDKVVQARNSWLWVKRPGFEPGPERVSNGSFGVIEWAASRRRVARKDRRVKVRFVDLGNAVAWYQPLQAQSQLALGYATTIHKAQGSEFDHVVVVIPWSRRSTSKELLYTALTRHRRQLTILLQQPDRHDGREKLRLRDVAPTLQRRETLLSRFLV